MPAAYGFDVSIITPDGVAFQEYGRQRAGHSKIVSTKIRSQDGQSFQIRIKTAWPFPFPEEEEARARSLKSRYSLRSSQQQDAVDQNSDSDGYGSDAPDNYEFAVHVYIDGRKREECSCLLYPDPESSDYDPDGYLLEGRYEPVVSNSNSQDQQMILREWVFTSKGIEVLLGKLDIAAPDPEILPNVLELELEEATKTLAKDTLSAPDGRFKRGQIEIKIGRVWDVGETPLPPVWRKSRAEIEEGVADDEDDFTTHNVGVNSNRGSEFTGVGRQLKFVNPDEDFFVKFVFQYMGIEKLVNLGLCTEDGKAREHQGPDEAKGRSRETCSGSSEPQPGSLKRSKGVISGRTQASGHQSTNTLMLSDEDDADSEAMLSSDSDDGPARKALKYGGKAPVRKRRAGVKGKQSRWHGRACCRLQDRTG